MTLVEHAGGVTTFRPLGTRELLETATPEQAASYMIRCSRIAARLHWKPWPPIFTKCYQMGLLGLEGLCTHAAYCTAMYPEMHEYRGPEEDSATPAGWAARAVDGAGYVLSTCRDEFPRWRGAPDWVISRCWWAARDDDQALQRLRDENIRHLVHIWRGNYQCVDLETVRRVEAAGNAAKSLEAAKEEALR